jgi:hypothetical protein
MASAEKAVEMSSLVFKAKPPSIEGRRNAGRARRARPAHARPDKTSPNREFPSAKAIPDLAE